MVQNVVIIGAGPAGLLLAHHLLHRGNYHINIYERRSDPRLGDVSGDRTFPISLQERGRKAIRAIVGLEEAIADQSVFCQGTIIHSNKGKRLIPRQNQILTIDRNRLVRILLKHLTETDSPNSVKLHFNCECTDTFNPEKSGNYRKFLSVAQSGMRLSRQMWRYLSKPSTEY